MLYFNQEIIGMKVHHFKQKSNPICYKGDNFENVFLESIWKIYLKSYVKCTGNTHAINHMKQIQ